MPTGPVKAQKSVLPPWVACSGVTMPCKPVHSRSQGQQVVFASAANSHRFHCSAVQESGIGAVASIMIVIKPSPLLLMHLVTFLPGEQIMPVGGVEHL